MNVRSKLFYAYVALSALYAATFLLPRRISVLPQLADDQYRLLAITVLVPALIIWYLAFYGYSKLKRYSRLIAGTPDGQQVAKIATGVMILAIGLPVNSIFSGTVSMIAQHYPHFIPTAIILRNYCTMLIPLAGFVQISRGAFGLAQLAKKKPRLRSMHGLAITFVIIATLYCFATANSTDLDTIYHLPEWLVLSTITIPYLYTWYIGLQSAYELHLYSRNAPGTLYRRTWNLLASGLASIIVMQIVVTYFATVTVGFRSLSPELVFATIYGLLALLSVGYILVALGAKRLQKIEEV